MLIRNATAFLDGRFVPGVDVRVKKGTVIEILVEAMGRVNYGPELYDRKGIRQGVCIGNQFLHDWEMIPVNTELLPALPFGKTAHYYAAE